MEKKLLANIESVLRACEIRDGMTLSFHHHLRDGDQVLNMVMQRVTELGIQNLHIAASSIFPVHQPLVDCIRKGVVSRLSAPYIAGPVAQAISQGKLDVQVVMQTHGGRAHAISQGRLPIDIAFVGAPTSDNKGNCNGIQGKSAFGVMGYPRVDVQHAKKVVVITDNLVRYPACPAEITQEQVDFVVKVASIGNPQGIVSGSTRAATDPMALQIAQDAVNVIRASGLLKEGFSFQTGAGGISLASSGLLAGLMQRDGIRGSFASGGITGFLVDMLNDNLFETLLDVQCFDLRAVQSYGQNSRHQGMSAAQYASPGSRGSVVDDLDVVMLGAAEVDLNFNVNVTTGSDGRILGGSGGHADTAAGAKLAIVTTRLNAGGFAKIVDQVNTVTTPGRTVDVVVTDHGIAVNPQRHDLSSQLADFGLPIRDVRTLREIALAASSKQQVLAHDEAKLVAVVENRDGSILDVVRAVSEPLG
ncbi:citrate lyase subunit alpha / citrate CoA-transferase [Ectothiorhodosinus mongolicus]|uniref:Citrate lyase alpha chain n=1 Tax=Ectothiorhodosinus mongolicus TaxID=233100 RepID=A0A1R3W8N3_9GAMM|nr:citrate lyase subunit alpha [Ectothiorhodosinus mongolicus]ULX57692.1 citrate lyase subunit alpha [Ectothiorhodosinus mongolicus]SIT73597.1 citrate lyase subunit alpha / citrate CoA-transferase [Ectothiorhodosinus mongolicus]